MKVVFILAAAVAVSALCGGCMPETFTKIANDTGRNISLKVRAAGVEIFSFDKVMPGEDAGAAVIEKFEELDSIEYSYDGRTCRMDQQEIRRLAEPDKFSSNRQKKTIRLVGC